MQKMLELQEQASAVLSIERQLLAERPPAAATVGLTQNESSNGLPDFPALELLRTIALGYAYMTLDDSLSECYESTCSISIRVAFITHTSNDMNRRYII